MPGSKLGDCLTSSPALKASSLRAFRFFDDFQAERAPDDRYVIAKLRALWDTKKIHKGGMLIVLLLAPIRSASAAKSVLQASATTDTDLKSRIVKVQTTLVAGPRNH